MSLLSPYDSAISTATKGHSHFRDKCLQEISSESIEIATIPVPLYFWNGVVKGGKQRGYIVGGLPGSWLCCRPKTKSQSHRRCDWLFPSEL
jgi:hypothetical protein